MGHFNSYVKLPEGTSEQKERKSYRSSESSLKKNHTRRPPTGELAGGAFSGGFTAGGSFRGVFPVVAKSKC